MRVFFTGATGFVGGHILARLLEREEVSVLLLARDPSPERLWRAMQPHFDFDRFRALLGGRVRAVGGDITEAGLGLSAADRALVTRETTSILHCAASLNRKSEKACLNTNLRGTLEMLDLARAIVADHGLRRFTHVSTVAVAGKRQDETVREDAAIDWERSDYDPYARTKKFCEHMIARLLPDVPRTILRPSVVLGDGRTGQTTQFDMVHAFAFLARLPILPLRPDHRIDIVPVDWVATAAAKIHLQTPPDHGIYHLSAGEASPTYRQITTALSRSPAYLPWLARPFDGMVRFLSSIAHGTGPGRAASRLQVFLPYLRFNTVFDNARAVAAAGAAPAPFPAYASRLLQWSLENRFAYPYREWPR